MVGNPTGHQPDDAAMSHEAARPYIHRYRSGVLRAALPPTLKLVLLTLAEFAGEDGGDCFPSMAKVADLAGVNEKTVRRLLQTPTPWLTRVERAGKERGWRAYGYRLLVPEGADTTPARWRGKQTDGADTMPAPSPERADTTPAPETVRCGHSSNEVRTLTPGGAGMVSADVGNEVGKSRLEDQEHEPADAGLSAAAPTDLSRPVRPACPHQRVIALYHEVLPELRQVRDWNDTRQRLLARRWAESAERQDLTWWRGFFGYVRRSRFLMGKVTGRDGRPFDCDLEWLIRPTNFAKVIEGKYEDAAA